MKTMINQHEHVIENKDDIAELISDGNWLRLHKIIAKDKYLNGHSYQSKCCDDCTKSHSILHFALQHNTPFCIIQRLVRLNPILIYEVNCMGHLPFQTALTQGTFPAILKCLLMENEKAAEVLDTEGKTSLHLVFDAYEKLRKSNSPVSKKAFEYFPEVICYVHSLNPLHILKEDKNGMDVLEYDKGKEVDYATIMMLHKMSMDAKMKEICLRVESNGEQCQDKNINQKIKRNSVRKVARRFSTTSWRNNLRG